MRRLIVTLGATLAVGLATFALFKRLELRSQEPIRRPFTATVLERRYSPEGIEGYSEYVTHAVRSDGSEVDVHRRQKPDGQWAFGKVIVDVQRKSRITVDPATESVTTYPLSNEDVARLVMPAAACTGDPNAPKSSALGYKVIRVYGTDQVTRSDRWLAPKLNCYPLRRISVLESGDGSGARTEDETLFITEGEPSPSLFEIPSSYMERAPSEVFAEFARRFPGRPCYDCSPGTSSVLDQAYRNAQTNR